MKCGAIDNVSAVSDRHQGAPPRFRRCSGPAAASRKDPSPLRVAWACSGFSGTEIRWDADLGGNLCCLDRLKQPIKPHRGRIPAAVTAHVRMGPSERIASGASATVVATRGSTYRKSGAQMLIAPDGRYQGLLSGGCLETDLAGHAKAVFETGEPRMVRYENQGDDDLLWGLGSGCEGGMDVWLVRLDPTTGWEPFGDLVRCFERRVAAAYGLVLASSIPGLRKGVAFCSASGLRPPDGVPCVVLDWIDRQLLGARSAANSGIVQLDEPPVTLFVAPVERASELLLIGGGPDALPVVDLAAMLGWWITVADHRPAYATVDRFPRARRVLLTTPADLPRATELSRFDAAVVMSHHLATDLAALSALAETSIPYVGLLGPASRRKRLLADLGAATAEMYGRRLHAPVGLDLGGRDTASIALAIVAEIQAFFHGNAQRLIQVWVRRDDDAGLARNSAGRRRSSRFGSPKQLADVHGKPMLTYALSTILELGSQVSITVVLGANADRLEPLVRKTSVNSVINEHHEQGVASSIHAGLSVMPPNTSAVLIALADQVAVTSDDLRRLVDGWQERPDCIVAARYADAIGAPAIFPASLFAELAALEGDRGAQVLLRRHAARVVTISMPAAALDIDTPGDLDALHSTVHSVR